METPFKAVTFSKNETITKDALNALQNNSQWLKENTPRGRFWTEGGSIRDEAYYKVGGRVYVPRNKKSATSVHRVSLKNAFHPMCSPNVTTGVVSQHAREIFCVVNGPGGRILSENFGFDISVHVEDGANRKYKISQPFFVYWKATGWRTDDPNDF